MRWKMASTGGGGSVRMAQCLYRDFRLGCIFKMGIRASTALVLGALDPSVSLLSR